MVRLLSGHTYDLAPARTRAALLFSPTMSACRQYATEAVLRARVAQIPAIEVLYGWSGEAIAQGRRWRDREGGGAQGRRRGRDPRCLLPAGLRRQPLESSATSPGITGTRPSTNKKNWYSSSSARPSCTTSWHASPASVLYNVLHPRPPRDYWQFFGRVNHGNSFFFHAPVPQDTTRDQFRFFAGYLHQRRRCRIRRRVRAYRFWDLACRHCRQLCKDRVFIAGDAAHSHPPLWRLPHQHWLRGCPQSRLEARRRAGRLGRTPTARGS